MKVSRNLFLAALISCVFPVVASETPVSTVSSKFTSFGKAVIHSPVDLLDIIATYSGSAKLVTYLTTVEGDANLSRVCALIANYPVAAKRIIASGVIAAIFYAGYKAQQSLTVQEEDLSDDEYDFGTFDDVE